MASRFSKKPDPSIKKNVQQARAAARKTKNAQMSLVTASIAATLFSWALFSNQDAQALEAARVASANQAVGLPSGTVTVATPTYILVAQQGIGTPAPLVLGVTR